MPIKDIEIPIAAQHIHEGTGGGGGGGGKKKGLKKISPPPKRGVFQGGVDRAASPPDRPAELAEPVRAW